jgi:hypothetical protein
MGSTLRIIFRFLRRSGFFKHRERRFSRIENRLSSVPKLLFGKAPARQALFAGTLRTRKTGVLRTDTLQNKSLGARRVGYVFDLLNLLCVLCAFSSISAVHTSHSLPFGKIVPYRLTARQLSGEQITGGVSGHSDSHRMGVRLVVSNIHFFTHIQIVIRLHFMRKLC